ncbi:UDP-N-acetylmuramoyl-tripeptide--D-alanyl-D-alanine ligase [Patescibacteria group bacterium]|nr:UDP-N-acetylmuramoyl-tripeptide--D-alanyl-D-alanine ligase [Patescibacteria group bacterium]
MKKILFNILRLLSKKIVKKYKPKIIGITGSVGKTTSKNAVYEVLKNRYKVRMSPKSYNSELGLPLTIMNLETSKSFFIWIINIFKGIKLLLKKDKNYPEILILEMGADKPGDISYLRNIIKPDIAILTEVSPSHLEKFDNLDNILKEKLQIFNTGDSDQKAILNLDNPLIKKSQTDIDANIITYGINEDADIKAFNINSTNTFDDNYTSGIEFDLKYKNETAHVKMQYLLGKHQIYSILSAFAIGVIFNLTLEDIKNSLEDTKPQNGRMSLLKGIKNTWIIDDTYNSSPIASVSALEALSSSSILGKKVAVLGDMLELGASSESEHKKIGYRVQDLEIDLLITVGERSRDIARGSIEAGMDENTVFTFSNTKDAGKFIQNRIKQNDLILIKGSQSIRCEKIVKEIMANPLNAKNLLVRQTGIWENK